MLKRAFNERIFVCFLMSKAGLAFNADHLVGKADIKFITIIVKILGRSRKLERMSEKVEPFFRKSLKILDKV